MPEKYHEKGGSEALPFNKFKGKAEYTRKRMRQYKVEPQELEEYANKLGLESKGLDIKNDEQMVTLTYRLQQECLKNPLIAKRLGKTNLLKDGMLGKYTLRSIKYILKEQEKEKLKEELKVAKPAPVEPAPVEPAPVEPAPVEPAPVEPAPVPRRNGSAENKMQRMPLDFKEPDAQEAKEPAPTHQETEKTIAELQQAITKTFDHPSNKMKAEMVVHHCEQVAAATSEEIIKNLTGKRVRVTIEKTPILADLTGKYRGKSPATLTEEDFFDVPIGTVFFMNDPNLYNGANSLLTGTFDQKPKINGSRHWITYKGLVLKNGKYEPRFADNQGLDKNMRDFKSLSKALTGRPRVIVQLHYPLAPYMPKPTEDITEKND